MRVFRRLVLFYTTFLPLLVDRCVGKPKKP